jgi:hypothetical protein
MTETERTFTFLDEKIIDAAKLRTDPYDFAKSNAIMRKLIQFAPRESTFASRHGAKP